MPFAVAFVALAGVSGLTSRWLRRAEPSEADPGARIETTALTVRRTGVTLALGALAVAIAALLSGGAGGRARRGGRRGGGG